MKIGIILTTFLRDLLLLDSMNSILEHRPPNSEIYIVDQNPTLSKKEHYSHFAHYIEAPYNSGLSFCRNLGVERARKDNCDYILISADSIKFNASMVKCDEIITNLAPYYDLIGLQLDNRIPWEAKMRLIPQEAIELDFIEKITPNYKINEINAFDCDICKNFFIAKAEIFDKVKWDNDLRMSEHELFFIDCQKEGIKVGWTPNCSGTYIGVKDGEYANFRRKNFNEGLQILKKKLGIKGWTIYKHIERIKT